MEIKIIPYEDRKKHCTNFYLLGAQEEEDIKASAISIAGQNLAYKEIKQLITILDAIDMKKWLEKEITIQIGKNYVELSNQTKLV